MLSKLIRRAPFLIKLNNTVKALFGEKYLLYTNVTISLTLSGVGDALVQKYDTYSGGSESFDKVRTRNMCLSGIAVGVLCHHWYIFLERRLPGASLGAVFRKILLDQAVCSPLCIAALILTWGWLEGATGRDLLRDAESKAVRLYAAEWVVWPPAQFVNFYLVPPRYRVLYDNAVSLGYDVYTSHVKHSSRYRRQGE